MKRGASLKPPRLSDRSSGLLLHITSLPGPHGIGDLGPAAFEFLNFLKASGQRWWQILPLGPTGYGNSPYTCYSAFAGNPLLISLEELVKAGCLAAKDIVPEKAFPVGRVSFDAVRIFKDALLRRSFAVGERKFRSGIQAFRRINRLWLEDFALFMALKGKFGGGSWLDWPAEFRQRQSAAIKGAKKELAGEIAYHIYVQFVFARQWTALRDAAARLGIGFMGDVPIFVAEDSADVWSRRNEFHLDKEGKPSVVAGVPPDYFSATGQRWGNPLYRWDVMRRRGYDWWIARLAKAAKDVQAVRLDHFIGFYRYYEIPASEPNAIKGRYRPGPRHHFFHRVFDQLGRLELIAEDLGVLTPEVKKLRDAFSFPGMRVLQFAFGTDPEATNYRPHAFPHQCVVYTGTHDNDTTQGWFQAISSKFPDERRNVLAYTGTQGGQIHWDLIRLAWQSPANLAITPVQDLLGLGSTACMNRPGTNSGNWEWRVSEADLSSSLSERLLELTHVVGRSPS